MRSFSEYLLDLSDKVNLFKAEEEKTRIDGAFLEMTDAFTTEAKNKALEGNYEFPFVVCHPSKDKETPKESIDRFLKWLTIQGFGWKRVENTQVYMVDFSKGRIPGNNEKP